VHTVLGGILANGGWQAAQKDGTVYESSANRAQPKRSVNSKASATVSSYELLNEAIRQHE